MAAAAVVLNLMPVGRPGRPAEDCVARVESVKLWKRKQATDVDRRRGVDGVMRRGYECARA